MDDLPQRSRESLKRQFETSRKGRNKPANLREQVFPENFPNMWPTPKATIREDCPSERLRNTPDLSSAVKMWPTPRANDAEKRGNIANDPRNGLPAATMYATPQARDFRTGQQSRWDNPNRSRNLNDQIGGSLNPDWVEILMGFPIGWTDIECDELEEWQGWPAPLMNGMWGIHTATGSIRSEKFLHGDRFSRALTPKEFVFFNIESMQYDYEPPRVTTICENRKDRLKAIGNAVCPKQAVPIFMMIREWEHATD